MLRTQITDVAEKLPRLTQPSKFYPLLLTRVGQQKRRQGEPQAAQMEPRAQSKHEKAEVLVVLSPILLVNREAWLADVTSRLTPGCPAGCHQPDFGFFDYNASFTEDRLL